MDESYDAIVLGTGLKECILAGLLSVDGLKVFNLDKNGYYGGASASLNLQQVYEAFRAKGEKPNPALGASREYNVDIVPKFIMSSGGLVQMLLHTDVTRYLEFKSIVGSYVYRAGKVHKVPATDTEALKSPLMGLFEKRRAAKFLSYVAEFDEKDPKTFQGYDLTKMPMADLYKKFGLEPETIEFMGHAIALYREDSYLAQPALESVKKIKLYFESLSRYSKSPYIYPLYGLGELPQGFARLAAIYGGLYRLNAPIDKVVYDANGVACGLQSTENGQTAIAKCKFIIGDPSYFPDKVKKTGQVVRVICILSHPVDGTENAESSQIIVPQRQVGRKSDIYISIVSSANSVAPAGKWIAIVGTTVETTDPVKEVAPALALLGKIDEQFVSLQDTFEPISDGQKDKVFISKSFDATSHFETTVDDVLDMYKRITGKTLVMKPKEQPAEEGGAAAAAPQP